MTYVREHALPLIIAALLAVVLYVTISHNSPSATGAGTQTPPVCTMDGNFDNDAPGCVPPRHKP